MEGEIIWESYYETLINNLRCDEEKYWMFTYILTGVKWQKAPFSFIYLEIEFENQALSLSLGNRIWKQSTYLCFSVHYDPIKTKWKQSTFPVPWWILILRNILGINIGWIVHAPDPDLMNVFRFSVNN